MKIKKQLLNGLISISKQQLLLPFYHLVADTTPLYAKHLYYRARSVADFKNDIHTFLAFYEPISLQKMIALHAKNQLNQKKQVHLTFDDGLSNFYTTVAPILKEHKIPATIFINTNFIDNKDLFYRHKASLLIEKYEKGTLKEQQIFNEFVLENGSEKEVKPFLLSINSKNKDLLDVLALKVGVDFNAFLKTAKPYLTTQQIQHLLADGFTIGAHSKNHLLFSEIAETAQLSQLKESVQFVIQKFGVHYKVFSFPFTDLGVKKTFFKKVQSEKLVDLSFGVSGIKKDEIPFNFQRIIFEEAGKDATNFLMKSYLKYLLKIPFNKHKMPRN